MKTKFSRNLILTVFMLGTFAIGMTEYVVTGLLTQFATDLNVEVSTTGLLLTVYAISVALFGPILRIITLKFPVKPLLLVLVTIFVISNIIAATAPTFEVLLFSRLTSAAMHAPFFGLAMYVAINISKPEKRTAAIASVQGGLTIAVMIGVPFGSFLGGIIDWRLVFWVMALLGSLTIVGIILTTPNIKPAKVPKIKNELRMLKNKNILLVIAIIIFGYSGVFTAYTFMEPMLRDLAGFDTLGITVALFFFGLGAVTGNFTTGNISPPKITMGLIITFITLSLTLSFFTIFLKLSLTAIIIIFLFGAGTFGTVPLLNSKIILSAKEAPLLSGTIAASVFNIANAFGAALGTIILSSGLSYETITYIATGMVIFGLILTLITSKVEDKSLMKE